MSRVLAAGFAWWLTWDAFRRRRSSTTLERMLAAMPGDLRTDRDSLLYELMEPMAREMDRMYAQLAAGSGLCFGYTGAAAEEVGSAYGITRAPGESDENFRKRLIHACASPCGEPRGGRS